MTARNEQEAALAAHQPAAAVGETENNAGKPLSVQTAKLPAATVERANASEDSTGKLDTRSTCAVTCAGAGERSIDYTNLAKFFQPPMAGPRGAGGAGTSRPVKVRPDTA